MKRTQERLGYSHDNRYGVSGVRVLDGEDLAYGDRKKMQAQQQKDWIQQQLQEKRQREQMEKDEEDAYAQQDGTIVKLRTMMEEDQNAKRRQMQEAMRDYNRQMALEKKNKEAAQRAHELQQDKEEIERRDQSEFMNEDFKTTISAFQGHRYIPYNFKGLSEDQKHQIQNERRQQLRDNRMKQDNEKEEERLWALQQEANRQMQLANEMEIKRKQQEMMAAQRDQNQGLKLEKNQRWSNFYGEKDDLPSVEGQ